MSIAALTEPDDGPRSKRPAILAAAVECFGEVGFEATRWSEVATRVGIGQPALYHYFESKTHCLLTIMRLGLRNSDEAFRAAVAESSTAHDGLRAAVRAAFEVSPQEVQQNRILQANIALLAGRRSSEREEAERQACRKLVARIERNWADLVQHGIDRGEFARHDPLMMARSLLGLVVSVWRWYRPDGSLELPAIAGFIGGCCVRMVDEGPSGS
ncbi:MAG: TetR/AcrR family transcriptional regulator [Actinomycetota bacterium]|uniref:TetR/AcrR family transcriptional regulator n=1 Tax=Pseudonocardia sp. DR1-2 TaxID=2951168 RepID=UPI0020447F9A|nr:TetR/AcrR family transcriptional regulator [Pseudonocardia sp. DR1-2]MCM3849077.1 TetR/AcrR family transcriptional regulator [Pseudonocardia sp. DR1-2]